MKTDSISLHLCVLVSFCHIGQEQGEDCLTMKQRDPSMPSGEYTVLLSTYRQLDVYCDMDTEGGGWTVFQYRHNGTIDFYRTYQEYTDGFGDVNNEFWLGDSDFTYNDGVCFSAKDYGFSTTCAVDRRSGWWHVECTHINPNGPYCTPGTITAEPLIGAGMIYWPWKLGECLATSKIMFRRD